MKLSLLTLALLWATLAFGQTESTFTLHSDILGEARTCRVSLPYGYGETGQPPEGGYPLIILLDGGAFFHTTAGVVHFMSSARNGNAMLSPSIIVAIENVDRERDFTVNRVPIARENNSGGGGNFIRFMAQELIPYVDAHYATAPHRTLVGHSLGGLLTVSAYLSAASPFDAYLALDPSIWWDEALMQAQVQQASGAGLAKPLFVATANQGPNNEERNKLRHQALMAALEGRAGDSLRARLRYYPEEDHRSVPLVAIYHGLRFLNE